MGSHGNGKIRCVKERVGYRAKSSNRVANKIKISLYNVVFLSRTCNYFGCYWCVNLLAVNDEYIRREEMAVFFVS